MKTIHYIDYCTMGMLKRLAPHAHMAERFNNVFLTEDDIVVFEGFRTVEEDGTYGPHNVGKVCTTVYNDEFVTKSKVMTDVVLAITSYAYTYGAQHFITPQMARLWGVTDPYVLSNLKEDK